MAQPGLFSPLDVDLAFLHQQGVRVLVSVTEGPLPPERVAAFGITPLHIPVVDRTAPTQGQLEDFIARASAAIANGEAVGVHCLGGKGRTGTFLAAYEVHQGANLTDAIARIRKLRPDSIETAEQEDAVRIFARRR